MKPTLTDIRELLVVDKQKTDKHYYGVVQSINYKTKDGEQVPDSYNVSLGGTTDTVKCRKTCGAKVGDKVLVTLLSTGTGIVTNTIGGDTDASDAQKTADEAYEIAADIEERADSGEFDGEDGESITIESTLVEYVGSSSGTVAPAVGWTTTIPSVEAGNYLWTRNTVTFSDDTTTVSYTVSRQGEDGSDGEDGEDGEDGTSITITSTEIKYVASISGTTPPQAGWQTTIPAVSEGEYLWTRTIVEYSDNTSTTSYSVSYMATDVAAQYMTYINSTYGVRVYSGTGQPNNYAQINSNGLSVVKGGTTVASFGDSARIGVTSGFNQELTSSHYYFNNGNSTIMTMDATPTTPSAHTYTTNFAMKMTNGQIDSQELQVVNNTIGKLLVEGFGDNEGQIRLRARSTNTTAEYNMGIISVESDDSGKSQIDLLSNETYIGGDLNIASGKKIYIDDKQYIVSDSFSLDNQTLAKSTADTYPIDCAKTGYTLLGPMCFNIANASSSGANSSFCYVFGVAMSGNSLTVKVRNTNTTSSAKIKITAYCLYRAN